MASKSVKSCWITLFLIQAGNIKSVNIKIAAIEYQILEHMAHNNVKVS